MFVVNNLTREEREMRKRTKNRKELRALKDRIDRESREPGNYRYVQKILKQKKDRRDLEKQALDTVVMELRKISEMLNSIPSAIAGRKKEEEKIYTISFGLDIYSTAIAIKGKNIFYCVLDKTENIVATVCLLISMDKKLAARGIAIRGPEDVNISLEKGRSIAFARACFVAAEEKNTCRIRGRNRNIDIVKAIFKSKYKAQYAPELTDYEKRLISDI